MPDFPKKIVLSPEYGASFFNNLEMNLVVSEVNPYDVIESEALVKACIDKVRWSEARDRLVASGFPLKYLSSVDHWGWERNGEVIVEVVEVNGPYIVLDYDGSEYVIEKNAIKWRE